MRDEKVRQAIVDAVVEGIHFTPETAPQKIGHKALGRCLSDIAAMAGTPLAALVTMALPRDFAPEFAAEVRGLGKDGSYVTHASAP